MLNFILNRKRTNSKSQLLENVTLKLVDGNIIFECPNRKFRNHDKIVIIRNDGSDISYREECTIEKVGKEFTLDYNYYIFLRFKRKDGNIGYLTEPHFFRERREMDTYCNTYHYNDINSVMYRLESPQEMYTKKYPINITTISDENKQILFDRLYCHDEIELYSWYYCLDPRFFAFNEDEITILDNTQFYWVHDFVEFDIPAVTNENMGLLKEQVIDNYVNEKIENAINSIVDYEKQQFTPHFLDENGELKPITQMNYNLHLRKRDEEWNTDDNEFWNQYEYTGGIGNGCLHPKDFAKSDSTSDVLGDIGFTDEEVYGRAKNIEKSFLRLSFYDTPNRSNQTLYYYSTIFFDVNKLQSLYIKGKERDSKKKSYVDEYWKYEDNAPRITSEFNTYSKYNMSGCSDGFYLYLFPSVVPNVGDERDMYMKIDFNNAKFGKTATMALPMSDGKPVSPLLKEFPINYTNSEGGIDTKRYLSDVYIKIKVKNDSKLGYIWYLPYNFENSNVTLNLFEPKVNPGEKEGFINSRTGDTEYQGVAKLEFNKDIVDKFLIKAEFRTENKTLKVVSKHLLAHLNELSVNGVVIPKEEFPNGIINVPTSNQFTVVYDFDTEELNSLFYNNRAIRTLELGAAFTKVPNCFATNSTVGEVVLGSNIIMICSNAFQKCVLLDNVTLNNKLENIYSQAFQACYILKKITFPASLKYIGNGAFGRSQLSKLDFRQCSNLRISSFAFSKCYWLSDVVANNGSLLWDTAQHAIGETGHMGIFKDCCGLSMKRVESTEGKRTYTIDFEKTNRIIGYFKNLPSIGTYQNITGYFYEMFYCYNWEKRGVYVMDVKNPPFVYNFTSKKFITNNF